MVEMEDVFANRGLISQVVTPYHPDAASTASPIRDNMASTSSSLASLARSKLHLSVGSKSECSLHRWVLLKNSIVKAPEEPPLPTATDSDSITLSNHDREYQREVVDDDADSFVFPDADMFANFKRDDAGASTEAEWLDSVLETLEDDEGITVDVQPVDDDEDDLALSPLNSPASSSDDLATHPSYYPAPITIPYPLPYQALEQLSAGYDAPFYRDALPHGDGDVYDVEEMSVPEAVDDDSDDESSEAPTTPSLGRSDTSIGLSIDPALVPLPSERSPLRPLSLHQLYIRTADPSFDPFDLDPLPFPDDHPLQRNYNSHYQEC